MSHPPISRRLGSPATKSEDATQEAFPPLWLLSKDNMAAIQPLFHVVLNNRKGPLSLHSGSHTGHLP